MNLLESLRIALEAIRANKMRSFLTMLGVIIGVAAVILLVSVGQGAKSYISSEIEGLGSNLVFVMPGEVEFGQGGGHPGGQQNKLTMQDVKELKQNLSAGRKVIATISNTANVKYRNKLRTTTIAGVTANYSEVMNGSLESGRFILKPHEEGARNVCVLGKTVVKELFGGTNPIDERISIAGQKFTVLGVMQAKGQTMGQDQDDFVYVPISTAQELFNVDKVDQIVVRAEGPDEVEDTIAQVERILGRRLGKKDFSVRSQGEMLSMLQQVLGTLTLMLGGIAGISLLVGGIGIMNIMLVSVTERTREIGVRKAIGARTYDILGQFIIEAVTLSVLGGAFGILLGALGSSVLKQFLPSEITLWSVILAFLFSAAVGIFFGTYPAFKASRLDPIDALRYE